MARARGRHNGRSGPLATSDAAEVKVAKVVSKKAERERPDPPLHGPGPPVHGPGPPPPPPEPPPAASSSVLPSVTASSLLSSPDSPDPLSTYRSLLSLLKGASLDAKRDTDSPTSPADTAAYFSRFATEIKERMAALAILLRRVASDEDSYFAVSSLRRLAYRFTYLSTHGEAAHTHDKGHGGDIESLVKCGLLQHGEVPLERPFLNGDEWWHQHCRCCQRCQSASSSSTDTYCDYGRELKLCITHGFKSPFVSPPPEYSRRNYPNVAAFSAHVQKEIVDMLSVGAIKQVSRDFLKVVSPTMVILKSADIALALAKTGIEVVDSSTLEAANAALRKKGLREMKFRLVVDFTKSGVNDNLQRIPHSLITPADLIGAMRPGCWFSAIDFTKAFYNLAVAKEDMPYFGFVGPDGLSYAFTHSAFGLATSPWLQTVMSAEYARFVRNDGGLVFPYLDDMCSVGTDEITHTARMHKELARLDKLGVLVNEKKLQWPSQIITFLGLVFNSITMTVSIDNERARHYVSTIDEFLSHVQVGRSCPSNHWTSARKVAGRLQWVSGGIIQSGKTRLSSLWDYIHGKAASTSLLYDMCWWREVLNTIADVSSPPPPKLAKIVDSVRSSAAAAAFSGALLTPGALGDAHIVTSDASSDGFGYWWSSMDDPSNISIDALPLSLIEKEESSTVREALAVADFFERHRDRFKGRAVVVMTDNASLAYIINSGVAHSPRLRDLVRGILDTADSVKSPVLAMWVPRESNTFADLLSRLCPLPSSQHIHDHDLAINSLPN